MDFLSFYSHLLLCAADYLTIGSQCVIITDLLFFSLISEYTYVCDVNLFIFWTFKVFVVKTKKNIAKKGRIVRVLNTYIYI